MTPAAPLPEDASGVDDAGGAYLAGALAVEEVGGIDAIEGEAVGGIALAVGPDGLVAEAGVCAGSAGEFRVDAGGEDGCAGEAAGGQRDGVDLRSIEDIADGGIDGVHERGGVDLNGFALGCGDLELGGDGEGAVRLDVDVGGFLDVIAIGGEGKGIGADGEVDEAVLAFRVGLDGAGEGGLLIEDGNGGVGNDSA